MPLFRRAPPAPHIVGNPDPALSPPLPALLPPIPPVDPPPPARRKPAHILGRAGSLPRTALGHTSRRPRDWSASRDPAELLVSSPAHPRSHSKSRLRSRK